MFNEKLIEPLFKNLERWGMAATPDSKWVIIRPHSETDKYEFRIQTNDFDTLHRFYLVKNDRVKEKLISFLKNVGLWEEKSA